MVLNGGGLLEANGTQTHLTRVVPPDGNTAYSLQSEIDAIHSVLLPEFTKHVNSLSGLRVALWRLPSLFAYIAYNWLRSVSAIPVFLNDRWTISEVASVLQQYPCSAVILPFPAVSSSGLARASDRADLPPLISSLLDSRLERRSALPYVCHILREAGGEAKYTAKMAYISSDSSCHSSSDVDSENDNRPAAIFFTSGTTNRPKAVALTDRNLDVQSATKHHILRLDSSSVYAHLAPLYHVGGFSSAHATTALGGTHVFMSPSLHPSEKKSARAIFDRLCQTRCTTVVAVPATLRYLAEAVVRDKMTNFSVTVVLYGGAPLPQTLRTDLKTIFPNARIIGAYGMTECASSITFLDHSVLPHSSPLHSSAGWPPPHVELQVKLVDGSLDEYGEIWTRGPHVTPGYLSPKGNGFIGLEWDGWLRTGDLGMLDPVTGALFVRGRKGDVIRCGGETVLAPEVETCLLAHKFVRDAAVVGLPHDVLGSVVAAAVELSLPKYAFSPALLKLKTTCRLNLASYKRPKWIIPLKYLPRSSTGKVLKTEVAQKLKQRLFLDIGLPCDASL